MIFRLSRNKQGNTALLSIKSTLSSDNFFELYSEGDIPYEMRKSENEFFSGLQSVFWTKNQIKGFQLNNNNIYIEICNFSESGYENIDLCIIIDEELLNDDDFMNKLEGYVLLYDSVKDVTLRNIEARKASIDEEKRVSQLSYEFIESLLNKGNPIEIGLELREKVRMYIIQNRDSLVKRYQKEHMISIGKFKNSFFAAFIIMIAIFILNSAIDFENMITNLKFLPFSLSVPFLGMAYTVYKKNRINTQINEVLESNQLVGSENEHILSNSMEYLQNCKIKDFIIGDLRLILKYRFLDELQELRDLVEKYKCEGNKRNFLQDLRIFETKMYGKVPYAISQCEIRSQLKKESLVSKLEFLGIPLDVIAYNRVFLNIFNMMHRIFDFSFEGAELTLLNLHQLAIDYALNYQRGITEMESYFQVLDDMNKRITERINEIIESTGDGTISEAPKQIEIIPNERRISLANNLSQLQ